MSNAIPEHGQTLAFLITLVIFALVMVLVWRRKSPSASRFCGRPSRCCCCSRVPSDSDTSSRSRSSSGIPYPPSALFLLAIFGLTLLVIELFSWVSKLNERSRVLAQQLAILRDSLDREIASRRNAPGANAQES